MGTRDDIEADNDDDVNSNLLPKSSTDSSKVVALAHSHPPQPISAYTSVVSCILYTLCSVSMVLLNKAISSNMEPEVKKRLPDLAIVFYQCIIAVILVECARLLKVVEYPLFNFRTAKSWLPVNLLFIGMLCSGFMSLVYVSVPMVTIFKNLTNLITVWGDWYLFGEK
jgi:GDP-mannose transporter